MANSFLGFLGMPEDDEQLDYSSSLLGRPKRKSYGPDMGMLGLAAGLLEPTARGQIGPAFANGLKGWAGGIAAQRELDDADLKARRKDAASYGLNPVIDENGNAWVMSSSGVPKMITDFKPSNKVTTINAGGSHYVVDRQGNLVNSYQSTQDPNSVASTGVRVAPNGTSSESPGFGQAKGDIAESTARGEGRGKLPFEQAKSGIAVNEDWEKKTNQQTADRNAKLQGSLDQIDKTLSILNQPYTVGGKNLRVDEILSMATDTYGGAAGDAVLNAFGRQSAGDEMNTTLDQISKNLLMNTPRFEGPQSDQDVKTYNQLAGDLGNPLFSAEKRLQKLNTIKTLLDANRQSASGLMQQGRSSNAETPFQAKSGKYTMDFTSMDEAEKFLSELSDGDPMKVALQTEINRAKGITPQPFAYRPEEPVPQRTLTPPPSGPTKYQGDPRADEIKRRLKNKEINREEAIRQLQALGN